MFGISDPGIWLAYLLALVCLFYSIWFGITHWNKDDEESTNPQQPEKPQHSHIGGRQQNRNVEQFLHQDDRRQGYRSAQRSESGGQRGSRKLLGPQPAYFPRGTD